MLIGLLLFDEVERGEARMSEWLWFGLSLCRCLISLDFLLLASLVCSGLLGCFACPRNMRLVMETKGVYILFKRTSHNSKDFDVSRKQHQSRLRRIVAQACRLPAEACNQALCDDEACQ